MISRIFSSTGMACALAASTGLGLAMANTASATVVTTTVTVHNVGFGTFTETLTPHNTSGGYSSYSAASYQGFSWTRLSVNLSQSTQPQLQFSASNVSNSDTNASNNDTITFSTSASGLAPTSGQFASVQGTASSTLSGATDQQTADFSFVVTPSTSGSPTSGDSGPMPLNTKVPTTGSSISTTSPGQNLNPYTGSLTLSISAAYSINSNTQVGSGTIAANLSPQAVPTPEPATLAVFAIGAIGILGLRRRKA